MKRLISLSVHDIVDYVLRGGNIDNRIFNRQTMEEGTKVHQDVQNEQDASYYAEYPLETIYDVGEGLSLDISGRADGLIKKPDGSFVIDEIKSTVMDLALFKEANFKWHQGQAIFYAWMFARENHLSSMGVRLTYVRQYREDERLIQEDQFSFDDLEQEVKRVIGLYLENLAFQSQHEDSRNRSLRVLDFPFPTYRPGQEDLIAFSEKTAVTHTQGYCEAPTGIGKTVCILYPFLKTMAEENGPSKIYYLTSKTSIKRQALQTLALLGEKGADIRAVALTSKERICLNAPGLKKHCNPDECPFALGYYDKIKEVIRKAYKARSRFDEADILAIAKEESICPFQLELDLATYADVVICDYNYVFDPVVGMPEITATSLPLPYGLLVDEAHNLPSRAREMYSAVLSRSLLVQALESLPAKSYKTLRSKVTWVLDYVDKLTPPTDGQIEPLVRVDPDLVALLNVVASKSNDMEKRKPIVFPDPFLKLKAEIKAMSALPLEGADNYAIYNVFETDGKWDRLEVRCLDASQSIKRISERFQSALFFSGTLSPKDYYVSLLSGNPKTDPGQRLALPSPFDPAKRLVLVNSRLSTKYKDRDRTLIGVCQSLYAMAASHVGNYLFYFPSFQYLEKAYALFQKTDFRLLKQERAMSGEDKEAFLSAFGANPERTSIGFCVLGGIFGEGIELEKHALSGVGVVTVGIPSVDFQNELLKAYYERQTLNGFDYAYVYPGFNRVLQAAGRVIRDMDDKGVVLLIDSRYSMDKYGIMLSESMKGYRQADSPAEIKALCQRFWNPGQEGDNE